MTSLWLSVIPTFSRHATSWPRVRFGQHEVLDFPSDPDSRCRSRKFGGEAEALCPGVPTTDNFRMSRCIRQGGTESPWCWNSAIKKIMAEQGQALQDLGVEIPLLGRRCVLGWADNILFASRSVAQVQAAVDLFTNALHSKGLRWKASSMELPLVGYHGVFTGDAGAKTEEEEAPGAVWTDNDGQQHAFQRVAALELLGCKITTDDLCAVEFRLSRANAAFWSCRDIYCSTMISWRRRLHEFARRIRPIALYGSVLWTWGAGVASALQSAGKLMRRTS